MLFREVGVGARAGIRAACGVRASFGPMLMTCALALGGCLGELSEPEGVIDPAPTSDPGLPTEFPPVGPPATGSNGQPCGPSLQPARIWRLSDEQYRAAVADLLPGVTAPEISTPGRSRAEFLNLAELYPVSGALAVDLRSAAKTIATAATANLAQRLACAGGQPERPCAEAFVERFVTRAFRRPLEADERAAFAKLFALGAENGAGNGVRLVIEATLQAPSFLYRTELGRPADAGKNFALTPFELASALSFFLLDSIPDEPLWRAAEDGSLGRADGYQRELKRLLDLPRVRQNLARVFLKWTGLGAGVTTELVSEEYPEYDEALRQSLGAEATHFFTDVLTNGGTLRDLLTSRRTFVDKRLATLYGVPYTGNGAFEPVTLPAGQRAGIMTQAGFVVSKSRGEVVVHRGKWVREELLCGEIPSPPPGVSTEPPAGLFTPRELSDQRMQSSNCGACHALMDGLGLAFGQYDSLGRYTTKDEKGNAVDARGEIRFSDVDGPVTDALDMAQRLSGSQQARLCIETRMLAYALGRDSDVHADECQVRQLDEQIKAGGGRLLDLMSAIAMSPGFRARSGGQ